jgi:hypothetical protein
MSEAEMLHEHPKELDRIREGAPYGEHRPEVLARRMRIYVPLAAILTVLLLAGLVWFITFEKTAIETIPPAL